MIDTGFVDRVFIVSGWSSGKGNYDYEDDYMEQFRSYVELQTAFLNKSLGSIGATSSDGSALGLSRVQVRVRYATSKGSYSVSILYKLYGGVVSVTDFFSITESDGVDVIRFDGFNSSDIEDGLTRFSLGLLSKFISSVVRDYNLNYMNTCLGEAMTSFTPYKVQFSVSTPSVGGVSYLSESLVVFTVEDDFLVNLKSTELGSYFSKPLSEVRNYFYSSINVVDYLMRGDKGLFIGHLTSDELANFKGYTFLTLVKSIGKLLDTGFRMTKRLVYSLDGDMLTVYCLVIEETGTRHKNRFYVETLRVNISTCEVYDCDNTYFYSVGRSGLKRVEQVVDLKSIELNSEGVYL